MKRAIYNVSKKAKRNWSGVEAPRFDFDVLVEVASTFWSNQDKEYFFIL